MSHAVRATDMGAEPHTGGYMAARGAQRKRFTTILIAPRARVMRSNSDKVSLTGHVYGGKSRHYGVVIWWKYCTHAARGRIEGDK